MRFCSFKFFFGHDQKPDAIKNRNDNEQREKRDQGRKGLSRSLLAQYFKKSGEVKENRQQGNRVSQIQKSPEVLTQIKAVQAQMAKKKGQNDGE